jgi:hypothetical protein
MKTWDPIRILGTIAWVAIWWCCGPKTGNPDKRPIIILFALWTILPPLWFFLEGYLADRGQGFEEFKYSQELARNLWIGIAALIGLLIGIK